MIDYSDVLLTVDFDRTLTAPDSTVPRRNIAAIEYFMRHGGAFTVNTGRSLPMLRRRLNDVPVNAPLILYNGSALYDRGTLTALRPIELDLWQTVRELLRAFPDLNLELQGVDAHYRLCENPAWDRFCAAQGCAYAFAAEGSDIGPFLKFSLIGTLRDDTVAQLFSGTPEELARLDAAEEFVCTRYAGKVAAFRAAPRILDVHAYGVSKIAAARQLQARLGRRILVCAGDAENDVPMLSGADWAFCPADGVVADRFENVCGCADGAVADVIYEKIPAILRARA